MTSPNWAGAKASDRWSVIRDRADRRPGQKKVEKKA
jgi:hypothetical protein